MKQSRDLIITLQREIRMIDGNIRKAVSHLAAFYQNIQREGVRIV